MQRLMLEPATQMVTEDELINDEDYEDILEDMRMERERFGFDIGPPASAILSGVAAVTVGFTQHEDHKKITFHEEGAKEKKQLCNKILIIHRKLKLKVCYND
ncbi:hypothetical protein L1987_19027 [Smallanthus sonchifolius]|uniref:Uncharacterized protein n=1 Tax=Smallanthus sonchifolius TaxID=185202 RepID=A0ACB9J3I9_9ASTR|nr:hypothetical protein L1987_19027 [Smallanthus sonchifolius]